MNSGSRIWRKPPARPRRRADEAVTVAAFARHKPARRPLPDHLPRHRIVHPGPEACPCCGGTALRKLGEDVTETLERIPASWRVIQHVRERFSCRACETIAQEPAPFHPISRGRAGPELLAEVVFGKFGLHLPLHRQSERFAREGVPIEVSTLADWVGAVTTALAPLVGLIEAHVRRGARIHLDDTPVPVLAKGKTRTGRLWTAVRDDRPFGGPDPPAAAYFYSADRSGAHAETWLADYAGIVQADAFSGFGRLYEPGRKPGAMIEAACWAHARRKFFELADLQKAPMAIEAVARIDAIFAVEREINGRPPDERQAVRQTAPARSSMALEAWLRANRAKLSPKTKTAVAIDYMLKRWPAFTRFLDDGRICLSNNAAERAIRAPRGRPAQLDLRGLRAGGRRAAAMYTLIETGQAQRHRSTSLARRRPRPTAGPSRTPEPLTYYRGTGLWPLPLGKQPEKPADKPPVAKPSGPSPDAYPSSTVDKVWGSGSLSVGGTVYTPSCQLVMGGNA